MTLRSLLWGFVVLGVVAGLGGAARRHSVEMRNRAVEVAVDLEEVREAATAQGVPLPEALKRLKGAGANSVIVAEDTFASLRDAGAVTVLSDPSGGSRIIEVEPGLNGRILSALSRRSRFAAISTRPGETLVRMPWSIVETIGVGLPAADIEAARAAGLGVVGRIGAGRDADDARIGGLCRELSAAGVKTVIFTGDVVLGYPKRLEATARALRDAEIPLQYGSVEFGKQRGDAALTRLAPDRTVRVHAVTSAEMATATVPDNIQRFSLAARERNIRLCFVRLFLDAASPLDASISYVSGIRAALARGGMGSGPARGYPAFSTPAWLRAACGLAAGAGVVLLLDVVGGFIAAWGGVLLVVPLACAAMAAAPLDIGPKLVALVAGCVMPTLGIVSLRVSVRADWRDVVKGLLFPSMVTLCGVSLVVGLLGDVRFLVKADSFTGVKATLAVPVSIVALVELMGLKGERPAALLDTVRNRFRAGADWLSTPILAGQVLGAVATLVLLAMLILRSGNDPGVGVSDFELKVRAVLDKVLTVRPRFKDIIGHPAMMLAIAIRSRGPRWLAGALLLLGTVGQSSLLNTFCHLHTPLAASALRDGIGLALGLPAGLLLVRLWKNPVPDVA